MAEKPKRLKKNISFSEHERDIYEYLDGIKNASALIKRLVYNHMILEKGIVAPIIPTVQEINEPTRVEDEVSVTVDSEPEPKKTELTPEEIENQKLAMELKL